MSELDHIRLDQFLKLVNAVGSGGEAKHRIQNGEVAVNGGIETRRGRKLVNGDLIRFGDQEFKVDQDAD